MLILLGICKYIYPLLTSVYHDYIRETEELTVCCESVSEREREREIAVIA